MLLIYFHLKNQFPFDTQNCPIKIGSWQFDKHRINFKVTNNYSIIRDFTENPVWTIVEVNTFTKKSGSRYLYFN